MGVVEQVSWVVTFGFDLTGPSIQSTFHYAREFQRMGKRILWVNPIPVRNPSLARLQSRATVRARVRHKLLAHIRPLRRSDTGFLLYTPVYWPRVEEPAAWKLNEFLLLAQFAVLRHVLRITRYGIWAAGSFTCMPWVKLGKHLFFVYQAADFISDLRDVPPMVRDTIRRREQEMASMADVVFPASAEIRDRLAGLGVPPPKLVPLPHGVDAAHFAPEGPVAKRMEELRRPIAGYFGSLTDANDKEAYIALARAGFTVVLIGKILGDYTAAMREPGIVFTGPVPYEELPAYGRAFDVCLLPWRPGAWIRNSFPKKTMEYLALGKPIVGTRIPEVRKRFAEFVYEARDSADYVAQARKAIEEDSVELQKRRREVVRGETWAARFRKAVEALEQL